MISNSNNLYLCGANAPQRAKSAPSSLKKIEENIQ
jgi:hypothetical protein